MRLEAKMNETFNERYISKGGRHQGADLGIQGWQASRGRSRYPRAAGIKGQI